MQQSPQVEQELNGTEQGVQFESPHVSINTTPPKSIAIEMTLDPGVNIPMMLMILMV